MNTSKKSAALILSLAATIAFAQQTPATSKDQSPASKAVWTYKAKKLKRAEVDALLGKPEQLLFVDVRRPDELTTIGGFPTYFNIQTQDIEKHIAFIPKDRTIVTVSNHAGRAGRIADLLVSKGYRVAGAVGVQDYEAEGGVITKIAPRDPEKKS